MRGEAGGTRRCAQRAPGEKPTETVPDRKVDTAHGRDGNSGVWRTSVHWTNERGSGRDTAPAVTSAAGDPGAVRREGLACGPAALATPFGTTSFTTVLQDLITAAYGVRSGPGRARAGARAVTPAGAPPSPRRPRA